ncbi:hypothetical protein P5P86_13755 [Nocardioides sp. BP30]|uniref:hypothetical protein n=1 Tax=Nocardioides sp. BP30 TaxID=3036374 RepID=UPI0024684EF9|nr:hypothetical protein [Nocardioides sp. BP30]WGL51027.1 hypothetical protein P5P86_13755 [Nocardioides sp. BP30]
MYADTKPCQLCGAPVDLRPREAGDPTRVTEADGTPDERVCSNAECPSNRAAEDAPLP